MAASADAPPDWAFEASVAQFEMVRGFLCGSAARALTHAELEGESRSLAARLVAAGVAKGARVGLLAPNGVEWAVTAAAVLRIGAVLVPLSTLLRPPELDAQLQVAGVTHLVLARSFRGRTYVEDL